MKKENIDSNSSSFRAKSCLDKVWAKLPAVITESEVEVSNEDILLRKKEIKKIKRILLVPGIAPAIVGGICYLAQPSGSSGHVFGASVAFAIAYMILIGASCKKASDENNPHL